MYEIERKYLIEYPDTKKLLTCKNVSVIRITQIYLTQRSGINRRIRCCKQGGKTRYIYTEKKKITNIRRIENEKEISGEEYEKLLKEKDPECQIIKKTRFRVPYEGLLYEIDVFDGAKTRALMEAEIEDESVSVPIPPFVTVIKEVTDEPGYTNHSIARNGYQRF